MTEPIIDWGFQRLPPVDRIEELVGLWGRARAAAESMPACPCHGIISGAIDPDVMEHNMLGPLRARYQGEGHTELLALVEQRLRKSPFAGKRVAFTPWLKGLADAPLDQSARAVFYDDLHAALRFYAQAGAQFTCG